MFMKAISLWARQHRPAAILFIIALKVLLGLSALYTGILFTSLDISFSSGWLLLYTALFMITALLYQQQDGRYGRRIFMNYLLMTFAFLSTVVFFNRLDPVHTPAAAVAPSILPVKYKPTAAQILASLEYRDKHSLTRQEKRILRREFKLQLKKLAAAKLTGDKEKTKETVAIILTIIAATGLIVLLSALVCNLSCSGAEGAALVIFIAGMAGIIWGIAAVARHFKKRRQKRQAT